MKKFEFPDGATPLEDTSGLKIDWISNISQLNDVEAENIFLAVSKFLHNPRRRKVVDWFNSETLRKIHLDMLGNVWDWAGKYRSNTTNIGVRPYQIPSEVQKLCHDVYYWETHDTGIDLLEKAALVHYRLVFIHPFENGNGRHARLISDHFLHSHRYTIPLWPIEVNQEGLIRREYISSLQEADRGNIKQLVDLMYRYGAKCGN